MATLPNKVIEQMILAETNRRICRAEYFHTIRNILAMLAVVLLGSAFLSLPRAWEIALSPAWAVAWLLFRRWMTKGVKDECPQIVPVTDRDIPGSD